VNKRILVTGGAGFVGSHLCQALVDQGHSVLCVDNFQTGSLANVAHLVESGRFQIRMHDVTEPLTDIGAIDDIYNLACPASPPHYQMRPADTVLTSVLGVRNMLSLARETGAVLLQASTSEVYGDPLVHPQPENYWGNVNPVGPRACYDEGKRCAEALMVSARQQYGQPIRIARIFNTYGENMQPGDGRVVSNFIVQALRGEPLTIYGEGFQTRSFCHVSDLVTGLMALMEHPDPNFTGPVNLGNPGEFTIGELAELVLEMTGSTSELVHLPLPADDPQIRKPDIAVAEAELGWSPKVALRQGLERTIPYFAELIGRRASA
jgi:UDP-glucuronate decarboxylase